MSIGGEHWRGALAGSIGGDLRCILGSARLPAVAFGRQSLPIRKHASMFRLLRALLAATILIATTAAISVCAQTPPHALMPGQKLAFLPHKLCPPGVVRNESHLAGNSAGCWVTHATCLKYGRVAWFNSPTAGIIPFCLHGSGTANSDYRATYAPSDQACTSRHGYVVNLYGHACFVPSAPSR